MPRHPSTESFHLDLRTSPSQQHLNPSRSSSVHSHEDDLDLVDANDSNNNAASNHRLDQFHRRHQRNSTNMDSMVVGPNSADQSNSKQHKLDLYSIPVFLLEVLVLLGLGYGAYFLHFQYEHRPLLNGLYCDDLSYRQHFSSAHWTRLDNEQTLIGLLLLVPIVVIVFCELVNSMFGALKFRQIRALCTCCKLHSITRRTFRFAGAYLLGFLIVMISCDILATSTGRLRPYFAQQCPKVYLDHCISVNQQNNNSSLPLIQSRDALLAPVLSSSEPSILPPSAVSPSPIFSVLPESSKIKQQAPERSMFERQWVDLSSYKLTEICRFDPDDDQHRYYDMGMSWPSFPGAIITYACIYISCYLSFVGTARPVRLISCVLVMFLLLGAVLFNVQLVKLHYNHWDDTAAGAVLSLLVTVLVLLVYLNKFRDTHYYENQKLIKPRSFATNINQTSFTNNRGFSNEGGYNLDKTTDLSNGAMVDNGDAGGSTNDLPMRYFQIPRANYRSAPRPLSSLNQMR